MPRKIAAGALAMALLLACGCTDQVGLAHGDPGRDSGAQTPLLGSAQAPAPAAAPATPLPDSSNATVASANSAPLSSATAAPLSRSALQPSLPAVPAATAASAAAAGTAAVFSAVTVMLSPHVQQLAATDPRLTATAVATAVEHELQQHQLLAAGSEAPALAITVDDFTSTLASNAVVLGYTFRNVMLIGEVTLPGPGARPPFDVHARARLTSRDAGGNAPSLAGLYTRFAQLVVADLRGVEPPQESMPR